MFNVNSQRPFVNNGNNDIETFTIDSPNTTRERTEAHATISRILKIRNASRAFMENPHGEYKKMCGDPVAHQMLGQTNATTTDKAFGIPGPQGADFYHRSAIKDGNLITMYPGVSQKNIDKYFPEKMINADSKPGNFDSRGEMCVAYGFKPSLWEMAIHDRRDAKIGKIDVSALKGYATTIEALKGCPELARLKKISWNESYNFHLHAKAFHQMICGLPNQISDWNDPSDNKIIACIARLHQFLTFAVYLHNADHGRFCAHLRLIKQEISLLLLEPKIPLVTYEEFQKSHTQEFTRIIGFSEKESGLVTIEASPANSGMEAYTKALIDARALALDTSIDSVKKINLYYETELVDKRINDGKGLPSNVTLINAGPIWTFDSGRHCGGENIDREVAKLDCNNSHQCVVVDITAAKYKSLELNEATRALISKGQLTIIFWESLAKFGMFHADQEQYGRNIIVRATSRTPVNSRNLTEQAMMRPDARISAYTQFHCSEVLPKIRDLHYENAQFLRQHLGNSDVKKRIAEEEGLESPFAIFSDPHDIFPVRDSFGFSITTKSSGAGEGIVRVSGGSEKTADIKLQIAAHFQAQAISKYFSDSNASPVCDVTFFRQAVSKIGLLSSGTIKAQDFFELSGLLANLNKIAGLKKMLCAIYYQDRTTFQFLSHVYDSYFIGKNGKQRSDLLEELGGSRKPFQPLAEFYETLKKAVSLANVITGAESGFSAPPEEIASEALDVINTICIEHGSMDLLNEARTVLTPIAAKYRVIKQVMQDAIGQSNLSDMKQWCEKILQEVESTEPVNQHPHTSHGGLETYADEQYSPALGLLENAIRSVGTELGSGFPDYYSRLADAIKNHLTGSEIPFDCNGSNHNEFFYDSMDVDGIGVPQDSDWSIRGVDSLSGSAVLQHPWNWSDNSESETRRAIARLSSMKKKNKSRKLMWQRGYLGHTLWDGKQCVGRIRLRKNEGSSYLCEAGTRRQEAESLAAAKRWVRENALRNLRQPQLF